MKKLKMKIIDLHCILFIKFTMKKIYIKITILDIKKLIKGNYIGQFFRPVY